MEMSRIGIPIIFTLMFGLFSCNKVAPSGFWVGFQKELLKENISDQGPYGGHLAMHWKSKKEKAFSSKEIIDFATRNGWELVDTLEVRSEDLKTWDYNKIPIFPLSHTGFSSTPINDSMHEKFPRWINTGLKVYMFKTGWTTVDPGTGESNQVNGFVVLENSGSEMSVYHLWGE